MAANSLNTLSDILHSHLIKRGGVMYVPGSVSSQQKNAVPKGRHTFEDYIAALDNFEYAYRLYMENMYCKKVTMKSSDPNVDEKVFSFEDISHAFGLPDFEIDKSSDKKFSFLKLYAPFVAKVFGEYNGDYWPTYVSDMKLTDTPRTISEDDESLIMDEVESIKNSISTFVNSAMYQYPNDIDATISDKAIIDINNLLEAIHNRLVGNNEFSGTSIFEILNDYYASDRICEYLLTAIDDISEKYLELVEYKRRLVFSKGLANNYPETLNFFKLYYINSIVSSLKSPEDIANFFKAAKSTKDNLFLKYCKTITYDIKDRYAFCIPKDTLDNLVISNKDAIINGVKDKMTKDYDITFGIDEFFKQPVDNSKVNIKTLNSINESELESLYETIANYNDDEKGFYDGYNLIAGYIKYFQEKDPDGLNDNICLELAITTLFEKKYYLNYRLDTEIEELDVKKGVIQNDSPIVSNFLDNAVYLKPDHFNFVSFSPEEQKDCDMFFQYKEHIRSKIFYQKMKDEYDNLQNQLATNLDGIVNDLFDQLRNRGYFKNLSINITDLKNDINQDIRNRINKDLLTIITNINNDGLEDAKNKIRRNVIQGFSSLGISQQVINNILSTSTIINNIDGLVTVIGDGMDNSIRSLYQQFDGPFLFKRMIDSDMMMKYIKANFTSLPQFNYTRVAVKSKEIARVTRAFMNEPILKPTNGKVLRDFKIDPTTGDAVAVVETLGDRILECITSPGLIFNIAKNLGVYTSGDVMSTLKTMLNNDPSFIKSFLNELNRLDYNPPEKVKRIAEKLGLSRSQSATADISELITYISKSDDIGFFYQVNSDNGVLICYFEPIDEYHSEYQLKHIFTDINTPSQIKVYAEDLSGSLSVETYNGVGNAVISYNYGRDRNGNVRTIPYFSLACYLTNSFPTLTYPDAASLKVLLSGDNIPCVIKKIESVEGEKLSLARADDFEDLSVQMD